MKDLSARVCNEVEVPAWNEIQHGFYDLPVWDEVFISVARDIRAPIFIPVRSQLFREEQL